ncbi:unnamed protein product [Didymodactylos carnosus]|uniref:TLC domain-containing protein n=1 Tax=Didymodactylos carnosus TaxID=1234261 RepID=A0A813PR54_9BILA|nr:unnamed protein product [Didymodactylos carnosus]CAF0973735.1 unnamed protein product [Didymodactylos carnosus]CAF3534328.1 unnamed protein product [Didymodactylos carnosus]CAF3744931.1 unnamed protein product [Didymodactylos carnosus]
MTNLLFHFELNGDYNHHPIIYPAYVAKDDQWHEPITVPYYNLTQNNFTVTLARRGAKIHDILIPNNSNGHNGGYRSIILHFNNNETLNPFGSVRFDPEFVSNGVDKLPSDYPFFNSNEQNWIIHVDQENPNRVRFVYPKQRQAEVIYELLPNNELVITYIAYPMKDNREMLVDMTNYVFFNLRGYGDIKTHQIKVNANRVANPKQYANDTGDKRFRSVPINPEQAVNETKTFYFINRYGIGKNFIAELSEKETGIHLRIFGDQAGVYIDPLMEFAEQINGTTFIRNSISIRPRQSPIHQYDIRMPLSPEKLAAWKDLRGNFSMNPTYVDLVTGLWNTMAWYYAPHMWTNYTFPQSFVDDFTQHFYFPLHEITYIIYVAIFITLLRSAFESYICKPLVNWLALTKLNKLKFPESAWKCLLYTITWSYCVYLLTRRYNYFHEPYLIWDDWGAGMPVPVDIKIMYFVQCGFYLHSVYATLYMDYKRRDFYVMLLHHVLTMTLIFVSYATRYHKVGLLVLFAHDITDIWLELTKLLHYLSRQNGKDCPNWELAATCTFIMFTICWLLFRLYWFPLKVLYSTGVVTAYRAYDKGCGLYAFFNSLLWILLGLNIYWLFFICQFLYRVCVGQLKTLHDTREEEDEDEHIEEKPVTA